MPKKRYNTEEIIQKLRGANVLLSQGKTVSQACKPIGVSDQTYYRWRKIYGGMKVDQARRLTDLEAESSDAAAGRYPDILSHESRIRMIRWTVGSPSTPLQFGPDTGSASTW
jgi:hypothetical protein